MSGHHVRKAVRQRYAERAQSQPPYCEKSGCCTDAAESERLGYTEDQLQSLPEGADLGLGCGNPTAFAALKERETVLDLGSGAGIDCLLAARQVGKHGKVIGVDMTPEMIERARDNARAYGVDNVEFRLGEIEHLPVADASVDVVLSNCVINLSPDKPRVFREAYRALQPGGRLVVSDIVLLRPLPPAVRDSMEAYVGCVSGAAMKDEYLATIRVAGFRDIRILKEVSADAALPDVAAQSQELGSIAVSLTLEAWKGCSA